MSKSKSRWAHLEGPARKAFKKNPNMSRVELLYAVQPVKPPKKEYEVLYSFIRGLHKRLKAELSAEEITSDTHTSDYNEKDADIKGDAFLTWCKDNNVNPNQVTSAKMITHHGRVDFNPVLRFNSVGYQDIDAQFDELKTRLKRHAKPHKTPRKLKASAQEKCLVIYFSDEHVGLDMRSNGIYGVKYNEKVFRDRAFTSVLFDLHRLKAEHGRFDKILIAQMGDEIDHWNNKTTRGGHDLVTNMSNEEAHDVWVRTKMDFFDAMIEEDFAASYDFFGCANSNHSGKGVAYTAFRHLETYLSLKYPFVNFHIERGFMGLWSYGIHNLLLTHGKDEEFMMRAFPLHLDEKTGNHLRDFMDHQGLKNVRVVKGDLHQTAYDSVPNIQYRNVPSLCGVSDYSQLNFGKGMAGIGFDILRKDDLSVPQWDREFDLFASAA